MKSTPANQNEQWDNRECDAAVCASTSGLSCMVPVQGVAGHAWMYIRVWLALRSFTSKTCHHVEEAREALLLDQETLLPTR